MRKALIGMILAATVLSPVAAQAQRWQGGDRVREQNEPSNDERPARSEQRQERQEQRQERREARQTPQVQEQPQVQQQQAPVVQQRERGDRNRNGGGDGGNRNWRGNNDGNAGATGTGGTRDRSGDGNRRNWRGGGNQGSAYPQAWQGNPNDPQLRRYQETERRNQNRYDNNNRRGDWSGNRDGRSNWNRNWRNDNRYDWQRWRNTNRNIFRAGRYYSPYRNYGYNRFNIGFFLEPLFYGRNYWIGDPWQYRLPPAYPGTQWVRYYNDVLLVDIYTGEVLDVIYGFFW